MIHRQFKLVHETARNLALEYINESELDGRLVIVRETNRTLEQNALLHELFGQLEAGKLEWAGKARTAAEWKVLLISGHSIATGGEAEIVRGLEDELVNIRESSAAMSIKRLNSLIEYTQAFLETMVAK